MAGLIFTLCMSFSVAKPWLLENVRAVLNDRHERNGLIVSMCGANKGIAHNVVSFILAAADEALSCANSSDVPDALDVAERYLQIAQRIVTCRTQGMAQEHDEHQFVKAVEGVLAKVRAAKAYEALRANSSDVSEPRRFRHKQRGTTYTLIGEAQVQCPADSPLTEYEVVTVYRSDAGPLDDESGLWVRRKPEFEDGRFEPLSASPQAKEEEMSEAVTAQNVSVPRDALERLVLVAGANMHTVYPNSREAYQDAVRIAREILRATRPASPSSDITPQQGLSLAEALGKVLIKAGALRDGVVLTGPELLLAAETFCAEPRS